MAENGASTNGHRPARRRKHIYPPLEQMAAEQAVAATRPRVARTVRARAAVPDAAPDFGPEPAAPPAAPVMTAEPPVGTAEPEMIAVEPATDAVLDTADDDSAGTDVERVELRLSAVGMVDAGDVHFAQGALGAARADNVTVEQGAIGAALADNIQVSRGYARSILARQVQLDSAAARVVIAADVKVERSAIMLLVARRVAGDVRVLMDWRGAAAFGAVAGLIIGLLRRRPTKGDRASDKS